MTPNNLSTEKIFREYFCTMSLVRYHTDHGNDTTPLESFTQHRIGDYIWIYGSPILLLVGTVGNVLSILVLCRKALRPSTTMFYLTCLSFGDLFTLYTGLLRLWIRASFDVDVRTLSDPSCKIHTFLVYVSLDFTVWILVAVTVDRCLSVSMPFRAKRICTLKKARYVIGIILTVIVLKNTHFLWNLGLVHTWEFRCDGRNDEVDEFLRNIWPWIDFATFCFIPFSIMIVCNVKIIYEMVASQRKVRSHKSLFISNPEEKEAHKEAIVETNELVSIISREIVSNCENLVDRTTSQQDPTPKSQRSTASQQITQSQQNISNADAKETSRCNNNLISRAISVRSTAVSRQESKPQQSGRISSVTAMLLSVNCIFLLTTSPIQAFLIGEEQWFLDEGTNERLAWHNFWWAVVNMLQYLNNAIHLFLYCLTGPRFRLELRKMFKSKNRVSIVKEQSQALVRET